MTTEIFRPNLTEPIGQVRQAITYPFCISHAQQNINRNQIQYAWQYDVLSCGRPAADYGIPIVCSVSGVDITNTTASFDTFSACCPTSITGTNNYVQRRGCQTFCYTADETLAKGFDACVKDEAQKAVYNPGFENVAGRCQYIDYESLKKGVKSGATQHKVWSFQMIAGIGMAFLLVGGGIF